MKKKKIKYDVAKNGEEAVSKWRSGGFHLILVGVHIVSGSHPCLTSLGADGHPDARHGRYTGDKRDQEAGEDKRWVSKQALGSELNASAHRRRETCSARVSGLDVVGQEAGRGHHLGNHGSPCLYSCSR